LRPAVPGRAGGRSGYRQGAGQPGPAAAEDIRRHQQPREGEEQVSTRLWILAVAVAVPLGAGDASAADKGKKKDGRSFGALRAPDGDAARGLALDWLKQTAKADGAVLKGFDGVWTQAERPLLDRVADSLTLADAEAAKALADVRDLSQPAPLSVPAFLK